MSAIQAVGEGFPLMLDCYMALSVPYSISLANRLAEQDLHFTWMEDLLRHPAERFLLLSSFGGEGGWWVGKGFPFKTANRADLFHMATRLLNLLRGSRIQGANMDCSQL